MESQSKNAQPATFFIGTYGFGMTKAFITKRAENLQDSFRVMFYENPFIQVLGVPDGYVAGYEDWTHARHVTILNSCPKHKLTFLKVELSADALARLQKDGHIKSVKDTPKQIWSVNPFELLKLEAPDVTFTVLGPTAFEAVSLDEFALPEKLVAELRSMRVDCLQSLLPEMARETDAYKEMLEKYDVDFSLLFQKLLDRALQLTDYERAAQLELF